MEDEEKEEVRVKRGGRGKEVMPYGAKNTRYSPWGRLQVTMSGQSFTAYRKRSFDAQGG